MIISDKPKNGKFFTTDEKVLISCDFKLNDNCKFQYYKVYKNILLCKSNNNGKDICINCFNTKSKTGKNNWNYKYNKNENYFKEINTELKAYLLGFIAGDGCIKNDGLYLENHIDDIEILQLFKTSLGSDAPIFQGTRDKEKKYLQIDNKFKRPCK